MIRNHFFSNNKQFLDLYENAILVAMPQVSFCLGSPAVTTCCMVFGCFCRFFLWLAPCGWSGLVAWALFWWPRFGVLWLPWGSPLACSPQPWAETRWRRVRLSWLVATMEAPLGPRRGRSPTNRRLFRQPVQYIYRILDKQTDNKNCALVIPPRPFSQGATCCFSFFSY